MFSELVYKWLDVCLDAGIAELDFWEMTIAELGRAIESKRRVEKLQAQERASYDYILADLIGKSMSRIYNSSNHMPEINEVYPTLFDSKEIQEKQMDKKAEMSAIRFKQFANSFNTNYKKGGKES